MSVITWMKQGGRRYPQWTSPLGIGFAWSAFGQAPASSVSAQGMMTMMSWRRRLWGA